MGTLIVTKAHLQYAQSLIASPIPYPQVFFEDAKMLFVFFPLLDKKATYTAIARIGNAEIEPSAFGQTVIKFAKQDFVTDHEAFMPLIAKEFDKDAQKTLQHFATHMFLNLAAWYVCPLFAVNNYLCPYMPQSWILKYLSQKKALTQKEREAYCSGIIDFLAEVEKGLWIAPYIEHAGKLGRKGAAGLIFLIGMFLEAHEKEEALKSISKPGPPAEKPRNLHPSVLEFIESLDITDFPGKK